MNKQKNELIVALRQLANHVDDVSTLMKSFAEIEHGGPHNDSANDLKTLAQRFRCWSENIEKQDVKGG